MSSPDGPKATTIVLAAGSSSRMGVDKLMLERGGKPLLLYALDAARAAAVGDVVVVVRPSSPELRLARDRARVVENDEHAEGISSSIRAGIAALDDDVTYALLLLGDEPDVRPEALDRLFGEAARRRAPGGRVRYLDRPGHPVIFHHDVFGRLHTLRGDEGGGALLDDLDGAFALDVPWRAPRDVDVPADLA